MAPVADRSAERVLRTLGKPTRRRTRRGRVRVDDARGHAHPGSDAGGARDQEAPRQVQAQGRHASCRSRCYTPPGYKEGTRVPAILYAYPLDYASATTAGQVTGSEQEFTRLADYRLLLLAGYAIIDNAAFPIVGDPKKAYDTYLEQLVDDAQAAVDKAVELGVVDRDRIGVTGHSHGALMTANLHRAHRPVPRRRRDQRLVQQDAHAVRLPERAPLGVEGPERLPARSRRSSSPTRSSSRC